MILALYAYGNKLYIWYLIQPCAHIYIYIYIYIILLVNVSYILNLSEFLFLNSQPLFLLENKCLKYKLLYFVDSREF